MKDYFSKQSQAYAAFRPVYPEALYNFILDKVASKTQAWDCATGNGQVALQLAQHFNQVYATDISQAQLDQAPPIPNIIYGKFSAEKTNFEEDQFDLITVAQALHWFDREAFYKEVLRVGKPGSLLAVWGYGLLKIEPNLDAFIWEFYEAIVGPYWDNARKLVEQEYKTIAFPFDDIKAPRFSIDVQWTPTHLAGYLSSWSATQTYKEKNGHDPVEKFMDHILKRWPNGERKVSFPIFSRMGKLIK